MKIKYTLKTEDVNEKIEHGVFIDMSGKIIETTTIKHEMSVSEINDFIEKLKDEKEALGFDRENFNHSFIKAHLRNNVLCTGKLEYCSNRGENIHFYCNDCACVVAWSWEEFCRYYDCR